MNEAEVKALLVYIKVGMLILSARVFALLAVAMTFGLFCWAMYAPTQDREILAGGFAALVFLPVLLKTSQHLAQDQGA